MVNNNNTTMLPADTSGQALTPSNRRHFEGLPPDALDGCKPTLQFGGGSLGFGDDHADVMVSFNGQVGRIPAELALFHLDRFIEPGRMRLILMAGYHYGVTLERPATEPLYDVTNSSGVLLLSGITFDSASQIRDERQAEPDAYPEWQGEITYRLRRGAHMAKKSGAA